MIEPIGSNKNKKKDSHRLLVYTENHFPGGGNRYLIDMVDAISDQFDFLRITGNPEAFFPQDFDRLQGKVQVTTIPILTFARIYHRWKRPTLAIKFLVRALFLLLSPVVFLYNFLLFLALLIRIRPTTVLCCSGGYPSNRSTVIMLMAAWCCRVKAVLSIVSMPTPRRRWFFLFDLVMDKTVWSITQLIIINAAAIAAALNEQHDLPLYKSSVVYNGLNTKEADVSSDVGSELPEDFNGPGPLGNDSIVIGCIARLDHAKGVMVLFEAFAMLAERYPSLRLVLIGQGDASAELSAVVRQRGLDRKVLLTGYYNGPIAQLLHSMTIYAFPSLHEGFPYSILEAMRAGCAIVASRVGGIPEAINDGNEGLLFTPGSAQELQIALEKLINDASLRSRLGECAKERFLREFTLQKMRLRLDNVFPL